MYGAVESVAVLWRLRSHREIIIIIIINGVSWCNGNCGIYMLQKAKE